MPISHRRRCIFVHIPKTGGTSIEHALRMRGRHRREDRRRMVGPVRTAELKAFGLQANFLQHLTAREIRALVPREAVSGYLTFSVVRNPWDRMVSIYHRKDRDLLEQARAQGVELDDLVFPEFVEASLRVRHAHLRPQHEYITDAEGRLLVDVLARFETLEASFREICARLGIRARLPRKCASERPTPDHRPFFNERTRALVAGRYARDIDMFGYDFESVAS